MKREHIDGPIVRSGIIRIDLSEKQLAGIGLVAIAYNEAEILIDVALSKLFGLSPEMSLELTSRINGIDGKSELIKDGVKHSGGPASLVQLVNKTLGTEGKSGFSELKRYRDHIVHSRVHNAPSGIAQTPGKRGKTYDVLLTVEALEALAVRMEKIRLELVDMSNIIMKLNQLSGQPKSQIELEIQALTPPYQQRQKSRLSLPPLPKFPSESEVYQSHLRWQANQQSQIIDWLQQIISPPPSGNHHPAYRGGITMGMPPLPLMEAERKRKK